ncbi:glutamate racemase [Candidatus Thiodictyon syntrophicum]|jgi:glutamate racemase|uniref:Glutamate racemase n=1 Tax=Candidatus Thiodictyon syntrophicum TaxID=1166950 RepID=A0A2K8UCJ0_9GAMM|nr:glutamate racemase [Candidatus Thiodictyon syntrophicum]AUB83314.1 glutamate racemase [Candidatus Thiodictyon syntrophicum]
MTASRPIGVFDSGVGGLTVLAEIRRELPAEDLLYVADSGHAPYGDKPPALIEARAVALTGFLIGQGAKAVVVACNTATGAAARLLRSRYPVPIIAMEPAVKPAVGLTRSGVIGVLATRATLASHSFGRLLAQVGAGVQVLLQPCPGLVERVEAGDLDGDYTRALLADYLRPLLERGADSIVLGCTHYPYLRPLILDLAGPGVTVLDSGVAVARQVRRRLEADGLLAPAGRLGTERFWTSGCPVAGLGLVARLWRAAVTLEPLPDGVCRDSGLSSW